MNKKITLTLAVAALLQIAPAIVHAEAVYTSGDSAAFYLNLGKEDQAGRKYSSAWHYFEKAARLDPRNADAQLAIADVCMQMNRTAPAIKALEAATNIHPSDYSTQWKLVQLYFNYGQYNKVITMMPALYSKVDKPTGWAYMLGKSYYSVQNFGKANEYLQLSLKDDPTNAEAAYLIGRMYTQMENYQAAVPFYKKSLLLDSTSQPGRIYELAQALATAAHFEESLTYFKRALEHGYKARDDFYMNMAYTMADAKKTEEAIQMMKEMLERRPQDLGLIDGLADICYHSKRYKEAIAYWDRALGINDHDARALYRIGLAYIKMGKEKDGQQLCDKAISMDPALGVLKIEHSSPF